LYTSSGEEAQRIFAEDPTLFHLYHEGYRAQISKWPVDPLEFIAQDVNKKRSKPLVIADMGCGDAKLALKLAQSGHTVHSFDLVAINDQVTACDICSVPLANESVDVCVFCLSLMGTNLADYLAEAHRILKIGGKLKIAEISSRFESVKKFRRSLEKMGFTLMKQRNPPGDDQSYFLMFDFEKTDAKISNRNPKGLYLKPCLYKKR